MERVICRKHDHLVYHIPEYSVENIISDIDQIYQITEQSVENMTSWYQITE